MMGALCHCDGPRICCDCGNNSIGILDEEPDCDCEN